MTDKTSAEIQEEEDEGYTSAFDEAAVAKGAVPPEDEGDAEAEEVAAAAEDPYAELPEVAVERIKELEHRISSDNGRVSAYQSQVAGLQAALDAATKKPTDTEIAAAMESDTGWNEFTEEYPTVAAAIESHLDGKLKEIDSRISTRLAPVETRMAEASIQDGYNYLDSAHEGWRDRVDSDVFADWIQTQPDVVQKWADSDDVKEAESLISYYDNYLAATGKMSMFYDNAGASPPQETENRDSATDLQERRRQQLEAGDTPGSSGAGVDVTSATSGSFGSAFKVFADRKQRENAANRR